MSFASSAMARRLSNTGRLILNKCAAFAHATLPQFCLLCDAAACESVLCAECYQQLPWLPAVRCPQCAATTLHGRHCGACLSHPPRFDAIVAAFAYEWPLAPLIHRYKYGGNLALAHLFARAFSPPASAIDFIVPMPLAAARLRERGFNQALEIARLIGARTGIAVAPAACRRVRDTAPQANLAWQDRAKNLRGAFVCDIDLRGKRVAVVDDVLTSGATLNEISRNLRKAGAVEIQGWVVARTLKQG